MKKIIAIVMVLLLVTTASAWNTNPGYNPFEVIWNAINELFTRMAACEAKNAELEARILVLEGGTGEPEFCNGLDDDSDGQIDEDWPELGDVCSVGIGACMASGVYVCTLDELDTECNAVPGEPTAEVCNGIDDDCDGTVDEGGVCDVCGDGFCTGAENALNCPADCPPVCGDDFCTHDEDANTCPEDCPAVCGDGYCTHDEDIGSCPIDCGECSPGETRSCYTGPEGTIGVGVCTAGTETCTAGSVWGGCVGEVLPSPELCDGEDNDCDGIEDEGNPGGGSPCDTGLMGVCASGTEQCQSGSLMCVQNVMASPELCDGLDNDCDGVVDEGNPQGGGACNTGLPGICAAGTLQCQSGSLVCVQLNFPMVEMCNAVDDDCDGSVDEGAPAVLCPPTPHVLTTACSAGNCIITSCSAGWFDMDNMYSNGCECEEDAWEDNDACLSSTNLGTLTDTLSQRIIVSGNIAPEEDVDWYRVYADDIYEAGAESFFFRVRLSSNPSAAFRIELHKGDCSSSEYKVGTTACTINTGHSIHYNGLDFEMPGDCFAKADDSEDYYIKVYRDESASPLCTSYNLEFSNGHYS